MRSITSLDLQYAHRFYEFQGEANFLDSLLPWPKPLPEECRKKKKTRTR